MATVQAVQDCLTKLWNHYGSGSATKEQIAWKLAIYVERLQAVDYRDLKAACDATLDEDDRFPTVSRLKKLAKEFAEKRAAAEALEAKQIQDLGQLSAHMRNEAVLLLGGFARDVPDLCGGDPNQLRNFWAEAANVWSRVRPSGGLRQIDEERRRAAVGGAMEAWARRHLGAPPMAAAYATPRMLEAYHALTGEEPILDHGSPPPPVTQIYRTTLRGTGGRT
ncbi:MAG: hypothetical protein RJA36_1495 [Pseudomonadota bacterium]|jgi:hypothetical protein